MCRHLRIKINKMNKLLLTLLIVSMAIGLVLTGCNSPSQKAENAEKNLEEAKEDLDKAQQEYLVDVENYKLQTAERIATNNKSIEEFNARIAKEKKDVQAEYRMKIAELEQRNIEMKKRIDEYKADGKDQWEVFKSEFNRDMDELGTAFSNMTVKNNK